MSEIGPELLEATFVLIGLLLAVTGVRSFLDRTNPRRVTKDNYGVIKAQAPLAAVLFVIQVVLMYLWAF
jgi:uncharacterized membrane protein